MTKPNLLLVLSLALVPGLALAQTAMRPRILTAPAASPPATEMMPEWAKQTQALANRVAVLEEDLNRTRQELAAFKAQYAGHTHRVPTGNVVYDKTGKVIGYKIYAGTVASALPGSDTPGI